MIIISVVELNFKNDFLKFTVKTLQQAWSSYAEKLFVLKKTRQYGCEALNSTENDKDCNNYDAAGGNCCIF